MAMQVSALGKALQHTYDLGKHPAIVRIGPKKAQVLMQA